MTPKQIELVESSWAKVAPISGTAADLFYDRLFALDATLRPLFPEDMAEQKKKLMQMIATAVANLKNLGEIVPAVEELGKRHASYGVEDSHYDTAGSALLWTLSQGLGDDFTADTEAAWTETYSVLADTMKKAAACAA